MSVSEFSTTLRSRIAKSIKQKISRHSNTLKGFIGADTDKVKALRTKLQGAKFNNIVITKQGFDKLAEKLVGSNISYSTYTQYMIYRRNNSSIPSSLEEINSNNTKNSASNNNPKTQDPWTIIYNTPYENLFKWTQEYLILTGVPKDRVKLVLGDFDAGHTLGLATFRSLVSFGSSVSLDQGGKVLIREEPDLAYFDRLNQLLLDLDLAATNSIKSNTGIYTKAVKDFKEKAQFYIEMQVRENTEGTGNQQTGKMLTDLAKAMSKFAQASTAGNRNLNTEFQGIVKNIEKLEAQARIVLEQYPEDMRKAALENLDTLLNLRGSRSLKEHIEDTIVDSLKGKKIKKERVTYNEIKIGNLEDPFKLLKHEVSILVKELRKTTKKTQEALQKRKAINLRSKKGQFTNLVSIQQLLNDRLHDQIQQNMGSPALNYKTGRFARSAEVLNMTMSREGMITAFYTYMKNPYQTFEPGFAQGSAARNPKTLISRSIREIATTIVGNRLRAVSV